MTRGATIWKASSALAKKCFAAWTSRVALNQNSRVFPRLSLLLGRDRPTPLSLSHRCASTRQESVVLLRCAQQRFSSSGAYRWTRAVHGRVINRESSFLHELFEVAVTEPIPEIPPYTQQNDLCFPHGAI